MVPLTLMVPPASSLSRRIRRLAARAIRRRFSHPGRRARSRADGSANDAPLTKSSSKIVGSGSPDMAVPFMINR
jgi:hypothetical protein